MQVSGSSSCSQEGQEGQKTNLPKGLIGKNLPNNKQLEAIVYIGLTIWEVVVVRPKLEKSANEDIICVQSQDVRNPQSATTQVTNRGGRLRFGAIKGPK